MANDLDWWRGSCLVRMKAALTDYQMVSCWVRQLASLLAVWMGPGVKKNQQLETCFSKVVQYETDTLS